MTVINDNCLYAIFALGNPMPVLAHSRIAALAKCYDLSCRANEAWNTPSFMWCFNTDERIDGSEIIDEWRQLGWSMPKRSA
jgi:hypothetical protein